MGLLLDTHAFLWWLTGDRKLPERTRRAIEIEEYVYVSAVTAWEIATKHKLGKLPDVELIVGDLAGEIDVQGFYPLPISVAHGQAAAQLPYHHRDPFDRILVAQSLLDGHNLVSNEAFLETYGISRVW